MDVVISPGPLNGTVDAIPSKSQAHRALICASLADAPTHIDCASESADIAATAACLNALGAEILSEPGGYRARPLEPLRYPEHTCEQGGHHDDSPGQEQDEPVVLLPCGESGSTFRIMLPIIGALGRGAAFMLEGRLPERPISPLYEELVRHGCKLSRQGAVPFHVSGKLTPGTYTLDAGVSSQFISGLLFALPLLEGDSELLLSGSVESFPYIELTMAMQETFGVETLLCDGDGGYGNRDDNDDGSNSGDDASGMVFSIPGGQAYRSPGRMRVEGDWSNAAFWLSAGAVAGGPVTCVGLDPRSRQGDKAIVGILKRFGARCDINGDAVTVSGGEMRGIEIDARDIPDLVPILAVVGAAAEGTTVINNAGRLRGKESDRLAAVSSVLRGLGADVQETEDGLLIKGGAPLAGGNASSWGDHRIAMSAAIAAAICAKPVTIHGAQAVRKSYPGFFKDLRALVTNVGTTQ